MRSEDVQNAPLVICHFEDEPGKVALPELIESGLYDLEDVTDSSIEWDTARSRYTITYTYLNKARLITYLVEDGKEAMDRVLASIGECRQILHIVDMALGNDKNAGARIVRELIASGVGEEKIWMLTAYASEALGQTREMKRSIRIISKPANFRSIRDAILELVLIN